MIVSNTDKYNKAYGVTRNQILTTEDLNLYDMLTRFDAGQDTGYWMDNKKLTTKLASTTFLQLALFITA